ncbi:phosphatidylinositol 4-phosphate 3-kinase C2 domain-containing subunit alpha-like [Anguilla rostrata]|uniref:phosphatidylinositol 4-phosphate 3-kinase C2 domain-containing subunit alpha-like n=1 Tax=Anguilla rostrata TaxID=7938 RepID=UPI0030D2FEFD
MAQISSGYKQDLSPSLGAADGPEGIVGKEEALRMEAEALARHQRRKRHSLPATSPSATAARLLARELQGAASRSGRQPEADLIVFAESEGERRGADGDGDGGGGRDGGGGGEKLSSEELERLLLQDSAGSGCASRPSALLGCSLSASYPGSQAFHPTPHQWGPWTPSHPQGPLFPCAVFPKPPPFQSGFPAPAPPFGASSSERAFFLSLPTSPAFVTFAPLQGPAPGPAPAVSPELAKLFDQIASTSKFLKDGRPSGGDRERLTPPLAPPLAPPPTKPAAPPAASRIEWLDLDPLSMGKADAEEAPPPEPEEAGPAGDPWDAVLLDEGDGGGGGASSPTPPARLQRPVPSRPRRAPRGVGLTRSHSLNIHPTSSQPDQSSQCDEGSGQAGSVRDVVQGGDTQNQETVAFCEEVASLRSRFPHDDPATNPGFILSPVLSQRGAHSDSTGGVKVSIEISESQEPVTFTCDGKTPPPPLTCDIKTPPLTCDSKTPSYLRSGFWAVARFGPWPGWDGGGVTVCLGCGVCACMTGVWGMCLYDSVYLYGSGCFHECGSPLSQHSLGCHEHVQNCRKWETEIKLQLLSRSAIRKDLARTAEDDSSPIDLEKHLDQVERPFKETVTRQGLVSLLEGYHKQVNACLQNEDTQYRTVDRVIHAAKSLCSLLDEVETPAITPATPPQVSLSRAYLYSHAPTATPPQVSLSRAYLYSHAPTVRTLLLYMLMTGSFPLSLSQVSSQSSGASTNGNPSPVEDALAELTSALYQLVKLFLRTFCPVTTQHAEREPGEGGASREASGTTEHLQFTLFAVHGITNAWVSSYEKYYLMCALTHNGRNLFKPIQSKKVGAYKSFFYHVKWDELIQFPVAVALLPLEAVLSLSLYGVLNQNAGGSPDPSKQRKPPELLGRVATPLFDFRGYGSAGSVSESPPLRGDKMTPPARPAPSQVDFPSSAVNILYVGPQPASLPDPQALEPLEPDLEKRLEKLCNKASTLGLTRADRLLLWDKRLHCRAYVRSLPKVLASAPSWDWGSMAEIRALLHHWPALLPVSALELLESKFADSQVRGVAVGWIQGCSDDELTDYLPQLVQALKFECHLKNALVMFLLSRARGNINVAHSLYWLLRDAMQDPCYGPRYESVLGALLCLCGAGLRAELDKQTRLVQLLGALADKVRQAGSSTRQAVLQEGLGGVQSFFQKHSCGLPLSPGLVVRDLNVKACSFFSSNAVPLKIAMVNADPLGEEVNVMFKVGEDLRQDMLAVQMVRIMDRVWLQEGLDLRIVNFRCISTGKDKGMVELVPASETLRKIQVEYGVTGSFKDKPLAEWLRKYNPTEDEYEKASENFIYSCAGCCVATYVLGIGDRHNDNIMLRSSGHVFHIDFGKFLGHAQMFGSFKRDRAPFVLTSDMAYVINGGERPTSRFQLFIDLCCQAYNLIRKHTGLFLSLLSLMTSSGLPELAGPQDLKYVHDALQPESSDAEATIFFTRLIESSLGSVATKFNFFIHNLAQMRFSGLASSDEPLLSFSPRTYTLKQDGRIRDASIFTFQKRYSPEKHYTYVVKMHREGQSEAQFVSRTFDEFQELHSKLSVLFPLWKLPGFPNKMVLGRTHVKDVAAKRKVELNNYIHNLLRSSTDVTQCDLVYTFFHPIGKDDKAEGLEGVSKPPEAPPISPTAGRVEGEVKLSVSYRNSTLFIMVMHIKGLVADDGMDPNPYVKTYLLPDPQKNSKRKTKISRKTRNPTFNEMLVYSGYSRETLAQRELLLSVLSAESLRENCCLGGLKLSLRDFDLSKETVRWYKLTAVPLF